MSNTSRRGFLIRAGAGAAAAGVAVVATPSLASTPAATQPSSSREPMMAYVSDPSKGEVTVMVGEHENVVTDHELVSRLLKAAR